MPFNGSLLLFLLSASFFALLFLPETHGQTLSQIENQFKGKGDRTKKPVPKKGGANRRNPKRTLETVKEAEKMIKAPESV